MHTLRRTATAVLVAVALVVVAGLGVFRQLRADARGPVPSTSALDAPIVPTASLDQTIADLQAHLAAAPDDAHSYAELGLAYSSQATTRKTRRTTPRRRRRCSGRSRSSPTTTQTR